MMMNFPASPKEMVSSFWRNRYLIKSLIKREIQGRYRGSIGGIFWSVINPVLLLLIYTFVFSMVFKSRWGGGTDSKTEFAMILFAGLIVFNLFAECFIRSPGLILSNVNYVKKIVFPLEILPWVSLGTAIFHAFISMFVWVTAYFILLGVPPATILLIPFIALPLFFLTVGVSWIFASLGVYIRDISQLVGITSTIIMFLTPIFYPITAIPEEYRSYLEVNPLTLQVEQVRDILYWGKAPSFESFASSFLISLLLACIGFYWFQKTRKGFADVI